MWATLGAFVGDVPSIKDLSSCLLIAGFSLDVSNGLQVTVQLKAAEDEKASLQQALKSEIELRMQLEGAVCWFLFTHSYLLISLHERMLMVKKDMMCFEVCKTLSVILVHTDEVQSLTEGLEKEKASRLLAEQRAQDACLRVDVLSSHFQDKEFDRHVSSVMFYYLWTSTVCYVPLVSLLFCSQSEQ